MRKPPSFFATYLIVYSAVTLVWTAFALAVMIKDHSWGTLGIAIMVSPVLNGFWWIANMLALVSLCAWRKKQGKDVPGKWTLAFISLAISLAAAVVTFFALFFIDAHGC